MRARWGAALVAAALAASAGARARDGSACELGRLPRTAATSQACMSCHDGSAGPGVPFQMAPDGRGMSHPVELDYAAVAAAHPAEYQPPDLLPPEVPLVGGKIECTTCHDAAAPGPRHVAPVRDLCLACHRL